MDIERAKTLRPVSEPRVFEGAYTDDQHERLLDVVRRNGPWKLIIAHHFSSAEELIATTSGSLPEGVTPTLDLFLSPVFRGFLSYDKIRAVVVENEMMFHTAEASGPASQRRPAGLAFHSRMEPDPDTEDGWRITTDGQVIQRIPEQEFRFLVHWGANLYMDFDELKATLDHTDDLEHDTVFDIFIEDLRARGEHFDPPSDPLRDKEFISLLNRVYGIDRPLSFPPEPEESVAA